MRDEAATLVEVLAARAAAQPDQVAYRFLSYPGRGPAEVTPVTYAALHAWSRSFAARLLRSAGPGDRVLVLCPPGLEYLAAFFGCLQAGMAAVPAFPPTSTPHLARVEAIARDADARLAIVGGTDDPAAIPEFGAGSGLRGDRVVLAASVPADPGDDAAALPGPDPGQLAFLQYTSGSTADPKGVMVSHGNLMANARAARQCFGLNPASEAVSWLPPYHDMGLIGGIIFPLYTGFASNLMSPLAFIRDPARWLQAVTDFRATVCPAPSFSYQMCADRIGDDVKAGLDLSTWVTALNGAEPVRADVMRRFAEAFAGCGFRHSSFQPCYGLAEATLVVSGGPPAAAPVIRYVSASGLAGGRFRPPEDLAAARPLASSGQVAPDTEVAIVDPQALTRAEPGQVGEIWVRGPAVAGGYFRKDAPTSEVFGARLADGSGPYLRTGDLGVLAEGELFVTGRASDLMIFGGRNVYPQDVEATCEASHPALAAARAAAFSLSGDNGEELVIIQELPRRRASPAELAGIRRAVRGAVSAAHQLSARVVLVPARKVPITSSGKVQRKACRAQYLDGQLADVAPEAVGPAPAAPQAPAAVTAEAPQSRQRSGPAPAGPDGAAPAAAAAAAQPRRPARAAAQVQEQLVTLIARHAGLPAGDIDRREPPATYGLSSVQVAAIAAELSDALGREVPATFAWDYPSIAAAAAGLAGSAAAAAVTGTPATGTGRPARPPGAAAPGEPVAVVGVGCRFPGGVSGAEDFWDLLAGGRSGVGEVPGDRWDAAAFFDPEPGTPGRVCSRAGGFVDGVRGFDAGLFGVSPREALSMDPLQRLALETGWEALEHAGIAPDRMRGSRTGVYIGVGASDYGRLRDGAAALDGYAATGGALNFVANRLSFVLGLAGPSLVVDTACSSSLVAVHLAVAGLRAGECDAALAGGVNVLLAPEVSVALSQGGMLSPAGRCATFDAAADGYVRGEGCGLVVLKRLSDAVEAGDDIWGVIRGTAVNSDGRSNGLTAPSGAAQADVISRALGAAGVAPAEVGYVEAHGTGTPLGDPIEVRALARVLGEGRDPGRPVRVGSVKTNIGHLEAAAGIAGFIKALLAVQRGQIPPHLNLTEPSPHIAWDELPVRVPVTLTDWPGERRVAGVSSFGFGGTNAHVILENAVGDL